MTEESREAGRAASTRYYKRGKARLLIAQLSDHGIPAIDDTAMPATYHANDGKDLDLSEDRTIESDPSGIEKPWNALWTAPGRTEGNGGVKTAWTDWQVSQGQDDFTTGVHVVHPQPGAVIVVIDSQEDAQALLDRYSFVGRYDDARYDWAAMQRDGIDGVYLSRRAEAGSWTPRDKTPLSRFHGWDAASVAWLSNKHLAKEDQQVPIAKYDITYETDDSDPDDEYPYEERTVNDDRMREHDAPRPPSLDGAWDRVPKKVRESKGAEAGLSSNEGASSGDQQDEKVSTRKVKTPKPKEYTEAVPKDQSVLDAGKDGIEFMRGFLEKSEKKREDAS